jgi:hypothetical protein
LLAWGGICYAQATIGGINMRLLPVAMLFFCAAAQSAVVTIDFESATESYLPYQENNFFFHADGGIASGIAEGQNLRNAFGFPGTASATKHVFWGQDDQTGGSLSMVVPLTMTFDLLAIDAAFADASGVGILEIIGMPGNGGGAITRFVQLSNDIATYDLSGLGLTGLVGVDFVTDISIAVPYELDNVVVNAVPIPAAAWLFGSALAALGWLRRKTCLL